jgi:hypothetical protein
VSLVENERTKLTATLFNTLATAVVAAGGLAPLAAMIYGMSNQHIAGVYVALIIVICVLMGAFLHWVGRSVLGRLRE